MNGHIPCDFKQSCREHEARMAAHERQWEIDEYEEACREAARADFVSTPEGVQCVMENLTDENMAEIYTVMANLIGLADGSKGADYMARITSQAEILRGVMVKEAQYHV